MKHASLQIPALVVGHDADLIYEVTDNGHKAGRVWRFRLGGDEDPGAGVFLLEACSNGHWHDVIMFGEPDTVVSSATFANAAHDLLTSGAFSGMPLQSRQVLADALNEVA